MNLSGKIKLINKKNDHVINNTAQKISSGKFYFSGTNACTNCSESIDNKGNLDFVSGNRYFNYTQQVSTHHFKQYPAIYLFDELIAFLQH